MKKAKTIKFSKVHDFQRFRKDGRVYVKVYSGQCVDERSGKDAIFSGKDEVEPLTKVAVSRV